jgi:hypothetical protein
MVLHSSTVFCLRIPKDLTQNEQISPYVLRKVWEIVCSKNGEILTHLVTLRFDVILISNA